MQGKLDVNPAAGKNVQNDYKSSGSKEEINYKGNNGGWGLVPLFIGLTSAALIIELVIFFVKRNKKVKKDDTNKFLVD